MSARALVAALLVVTSVRLRVMRWFPPAIAARAMERRVLGLAYPLAILGLVARRWRLAAVAAVLILLHRGGRPRHGIPPSRAGSLRLRLVTANVLCTNPRIAAMAEQILGDDADVVVLQEVTPTVAQALRASPLWPAYPHRCLADRDGFHGAATLSRYPVDSHEVLEIAGAPMLRTDIVTPHGPVRIINVHTLAPLSRGQAQRWERQLARLGVLAQADLPVILAGDFNATGDHGPFQRLVRGRLRDAFDVVGRGSGATWPVSRFTVPRLLRLDHVVVSDDIDVASLRASASVGSDHARLVADLGIPPIRRGGDAQHGTGRDGGATESDPLPSKGQGSGRFSPV